MSQIARDSGEQAPLEARLKKLTSKARRVGLTTFLFIMAEPELEYIGRKVVESISFENGKKASPSAI
ncbi:hypothetical protein L484_013343 [Morus notabilis]|uniref:Uncharacterized protein n=1 Tax=Morus notabilis TaxID=981085 RepID=W9S5T4_9ROSA|nr:hypothetical protein L484_013343 [Morus notabilis]